MTSLERYRESNMKKNKISLLQNFIYNEKIIIKWDAKMLYYQIIFVISSVFATYIGMIIPVQVVRCLESKKDMGAFLRNLSLYLLVYLVCNITSLESKQYLHRNSGTLMMPYMKKICKKSMRISYESLEKKELHELIGEVWNVLRNDYVIRDYIVGFSEIAITLVGIVWYGVIVLLNGKILFAVDVLICILSSFALRYVKKKQQEYIKGIELASRIVTYINKISMDQAAGKDIRIFNMKNILLGKYHEALENEDQIYGRIEGLHFNKSIFNEALFTAFHIMAYIFLGSKVLEGELLVSEFIFLVQIVTQFSEYISGFFSQFQSILKSDISIGYMRKFLLFEDSIKMRTLHLEREKKGNQIEFRNVSYRYPGAQEETLKNINLTIQANEKLAVIGLNGAGKTTLIKLICGLYQPTNGEIFIDGKDISKIENMDELVAALFQDSDILPVTVDANIVGTNEENRYKEDLMWAVRMSGFEKKYISLKDAGRTLLGKNVNTDASDLSGGEKQKLLFARALFQKTGILILDEPTAALDPISEKQMYMDLANITENRTTIFISHRLSSTAFCDRIIFLSHGEICESGTHEELMKKGGLYKELFDLQGRYYKESDEEKKDEC